MEGRKSHSRPGSKVSRLSTTREQSGRSWRREYLKRCGGLLKQWIEWQARRCVINSFFAAVFLNKRYGSGKFGSFLTSRACHR